MPALLASNDVAQLIVPPEANPPDKAVAWNFQRFDGMEPLDNAPNAHDPESGHGSGFDYGLATPGRYPRPGQLDQPIGQVYTPGYGGLTNTLGGQPLPVHDWRYPLHGTTLVSDYIVAMQMRGGVGQRGPSELGLAQTVKLADITNNPPQPESLESILSAGG